MLRHHMPTELSFLRIYSINSLEVMSARCRCHLRGVRFGTSAGLLGAFSPEHGFPLLGA